MRDPIPGGVGEVRRIGGVQVYGKPKPRIISKQPHGACALARKQLIT